ncbi:MAG: hypothetical protein JXR77_15750 [Lentisphaeria bacterium]|nr:hypothetical protein [Lentisphaeria bacterium]
MFEIGIVDRAYDLHRPRGCTVLTIEVEWWPGNEFGLWLPETVYMGEEIIWCNWGDDACQSWDRSGDTLRWRKSLAGFDLESTLEPDPAHSCIWFTHTFENTSDGVLAALNSQTCFHLVNAPQFISIRGERIWACLDGRWRTTDGVPRAESPDPRRVSFLREGIRTERTVVPSLGFPSATMPEQASHPAIIAEMFGGQGSVGIACRNYRSLFNNNDSILRCLHSGPFPIESLRPGEQAVQEAVLVFIEGDHEALVEHFEAIVPDGWAGPGN